jgi:hypothetical protein
MLPMLLASEEITMTAQISDTFMLKGEEHSLIGMKGGDLISPEQHGLRPSGRGKPRR